MILKSLYPTFLLACLRLRLLILLLIRLFRRLILYALLRVQLLLISLGNVRGLDDLDHLRVVRSRSSLMSTI